MNLKKIRNKKDFNHPQDDLLDLFKETVKLDFDFARELKLFDVVEANCFTISSKIGDSFIEILKEEHMVFIVTRRNWISKNKLELYFEVAEYGDSFELSSMIISGEYEQEES